MNYIADLDLKAIPTYGDILSWGAFVPFAPRILAVIQYPCTWAFQDVSDTETESAAVWPLIVLLLALTLSGLFFHTGQKTLMHTIIHRSPLYTLGAYCI